jgi:hypothetical protein
MFGKHHDDEAKELLKEANRKAVQQWSKDRDPTPQDVRVGRRGGQGVGSV